MEGEIDDSKNKQKRLERITELIDTERKYHYEIFLLCEVFYKPVITTPETSKEVKNLQVILEKIFKPIKEIQEISTAFLQVLELALKSYRDGEEYCVGEAFSLLSQGFSVYLPFNVNCESNRILIRDIKSNEKYLRLISPLVERYSEELNKRTINDFYIRPIQRGPTYELLLKDILKFTPQNHPDYEKLLQTQIILNNSILKMENQSKLRETSQKTIEIFRLIHIPGKFKKLRLEAAAHRILKLEDVQVKVSIYVGSTIKKPMKFKFFGFNDCFLLVSKTFTQKLELKYVFFLNNIISYDYNAEDSTIVILLNDNGVNESVRFVLASDFNALDKYFRENEKSKPTAAPVIPAVAPRDVLRRSASETKLKDSGETAFFSFQLTDSTDIDVSVITLRSSSVEDLSKF